MRSRLRWASARGLRAGGGSGSFFEGIRNFTKVIETGDYLRLSLYTEGVSVLSGTGANVNSGATITGRVLTEEGDDACICDWSYGLHWN
jgi:hypothetical protein